MDLLFLGRFRRVSAQNANLFYLLSAVFFSSKNPGSATGYRCIFSGSRMFKLLNYRNKFCYNTRAVADPGFPTRMGTTPEGLFDKILAENCTKMKEIVPGQFNWPPFKWIRQCCPINYNFLSHE